MKDVFGTVRFLRKETGVLQKDSVAAVRLFLNTILHIKAK